MKTAIILAAIAIIGVASFVVRPPGAPEGPAVPQRIISIVPSCTEFIYAVGAQDRLVAVTEYCLYPPEAKSKDKIGSLQLNFEKILSLKPDLIVSSDKLVEGSNRKLRDLGLNVMCIDPLSFGDIAAWLRAVGRMTGNAAQGEKAAGDLEDRVAVVERRLAGIVTRPSVYLEASSEPHAAAPGMTAHEVIVKAGGTNIFTEGRAGKWLPVSWEAVLARDPEVVVVAHDFEPQPSKRPGWAAMSAVKAGRVHAFEADFFLFPTPRMVTGLEKLSRVLHPEKW